MRELSIFIDESGDWGEYDYKSPYYIVTMVFHNQENDISSNLITLDERMAYIGCENHCVHAGPIIRGEYEYREYEPDVRRKLLKNLMSFVRHSDLNIDSIYIEKKHIGDEVEAERILKKNYLKPLDELRLLSRV